MSRSADEPATPQDVRTAAAKAAIWEISGRWLLVRNHEDVMTPTQ